MDKEGQRPNTPVFQSGNIGSKATPEYFVNVKGGKKDQEKVEKKRSRVSRKTLTIILGIVAGILIVILMVVLISNFVRPRGSRTEEVMPTTQTEIEDRAYKVLYSTGEDGYENAIVYLNDLIKDMGDLNYSSELIFDAYATRAYIAYQAGGADVAIDEALRLVKEADTDEKKYSIYRVLFYIYGKEGNKEKRKFYSDMMDELNVPENKIDGMGGITRENIDNEVGGDDDNE